MTSSFCDTELPLLYPVWRTCVSVYLYCDDWGLLVIVMTGLIHTARSHEMSRVVNFIIIRFLITHRIINIDKLSPRELLTICRDLSSVLNDHCVS